MSVCDVSFSLSSALRAVATYSGESPQLSEVHNLLGLSLLMTASRGADNSTPWPLLARDAFIVEAGRALGLTIRDIHPPEAAVGVQRAAEFRQHFDASYAPLIRRALEHHQPVLAWQGWEGKGEFHWGIITRDDPRGVGFAGVPHPHDLVTDTTQPEQVIRRPPVQVYVVEESSSPQASTHTFRALVIEHTARSLDPMLGTRFAVLNGAPAYRRWAELAPSIQTAIQMSLTRSLRSGIDGFCQSLSAPSKIPFTNDKLGSQLLDYAQSLRHEIDTVLDCLDSSAESSPPENTAPIVNAISRAAELTEQTFATLRHAAAQLT